jgi:hypothetical protein
VLAVAAFLTLFLSDNLLWFGSFADPEVQWNTLTLTREQRGVLDWLGDHALPQSYVSSSEQSINYLTPTYTNVRAWRGHNVNTPYVAARQKELEAVFATGKLLPTANPVYYIPARDLHWTPPSGSQPVYENAGYQVWLVGAPQR